MTSLGEKILKARRRHGMSRAELARRIKISQTSLYFLERGLTHDPHFSIVDNIAKALGVPLEAFRQEDGHAD